MFKNKTGRWGWRMGRGDIGWGRAWGRAFHLKPHLFWLRCGERDLTLIDLLGWNHSVIPKEENVKETVSVSGPLHFPFQTIFFMRCFDLIMHFLAPCVFILSVQATRHGYNFTIRIQLAALSSCFRIVEFLIYILLKSTLWFRHV